ncbi:MAG: hypothetical protein LBG28_13045 [Tannerella sp.]|nr:hypothetical protein [Tannerella sp.]
MGLKKLTRPSIEGLFSTISNMLVPAHVLEHLHLAYRIPPGFTLAQDTGYQGYRPEGVCRHSTGEKAKSKGDNVRVEHAIGSIKRYRTVKDECQRRRNLFAERNFSSCAAQFQD